MFVSKHGGQSEIVLRVKQGDNPTFGFLMPDHHIHPYFRFLVDHQELLESGGKSKEEEKEANTDYQTNGLGGGSLSLLGSIYGSAEEEDPQEEEKIKETEVKLVGSSGELDEKDESISKQSVPSFKEKVQALKRNRFVTTAKPGATPSLRKEDDTSGFPTAYMDKPRACPLPIVEPPSDLKRLVEKIVEFILKNGKEFEAVLVEQDSKIGRFPFLLPSNQYHPYYLRVLEKAQESKSSGRNSQSEKENLMRLGADRKPNLLNESDSQSLESDLPFDSDRREKFKMVIGKSKKDEQNPPSKTTHQQFGVSVDAAAAAAILQAATRGIKNPKLDILPKSLENGINNKEHTIDNAQHGVSVPVANAIAKNAAIAAEGEADSSEAGLTREQKLKAERLKRAKLFTAMLKSGSVMLNKGLSESGLSGLSGSKDANRSKEREGSSLPHDCDSLDQKQSQRKYSDDGFMERKSNQREHVRYRIREKDDDEDEEKEDDDNEEDDVEDDERDHKHSRRKHKSRHSSRHKHKRKHSSSKDRESKRRRKHRIGSSSEDDSEHRSRSDRHKKKKSHVESDEGKTHATISDQSKANLSDVGSSREVSRGLSHSLQPTETTQVSDDIRAKVRAMLLGNLKAG